MATKMVKASMGLGHEKQHIQSRLQQQSNNPHPHPQLEDLVNTVGLSLAQEFVQYLKGPEGEAALETILARQARVVSRLATTAEAREAARVAASEAICGSYDAVERKWGEAMRGGGSSVRVLVVGVGVYGLLLGVGVLLTLWRFALFGLT